MRAGVSRSGSLTLLLAWALALPLPARTDEVAPNARYLVLRVGEDGQVAVLHDQAVRVRPPPAWLPPPVETPPSRQQDHYLLTPAGQPGRTVAVSAPRWVRAEFTRGRVRHALVPVREPVVVARVPLDDEIVLEVTRPRDGWRSRVTLAPMPRPPGPKSAPPPAIDNRVDILVMGDGYREAERSLFETHVASLRSRFYAFTPYAEYAGFTRMTSLFVASAQSGADHPPYRSDCVAGTPTCCGDPEMQSDPRRGTMVDTALDAQFCAYNIYRLLTVSPARVYQEAAAAPDWDQVVVLVNDPVYGGAGGFPTVVSTNDQAATIAHHEWGHSFADLADEYDAAYPGYPACSDRGGVPCEVNVTDVTSRASLKWRDWVDGATPVPTPETSAYQHVVGLFEGARYLASGMYRPKQQCAMGVSGAAFCEVCREAIITQFYQGGFGQPSSGISLVDPGLEDPPPGPVALDHGATRVFSVPGPTLPGGSFSVQWRVDGAVVEGAATTSLTVTPVTPRPVRVEVDVVDTTPWVRPSRRAGLSASRAWQVTYANRGPTLGSLSPPDGVEGHLLSFSVTGSDADGDALTYSASALPAGAVFTAGGLFTWTPATGQAGSHAVTFSVTDQAATAHSTVTLTVTPNHPPVLDPPGTLLAAEGTPASFLFRAVDPDGDAVVFSSPGLPDSASLSADGAFTWTPGYDDAGPHPFLVVASDGLLSSTGEVTITVANTNRPPVVAPLARQSVTQGARLEVTVTAEDPDGDALHLSAAPLPDGATFDADARLFTWVPGTGQEGVTTVTFTASDGELDDQVVMEVEVTAPADHDGPGCGAAGPPLPGAPWGLAALAVLGRRARRRR